MVGFRKESFYIKKYGREIGKQKYQNVIEQRLKRDTRRSTSSTIECQLCKKQLKRITRTHLKNGCIENITPKEYKDRFPNSSIVSNDLKKLFSNTKESIIEKYGEELGTEKWKHYREIQAETNTFEYKAKKYNMSKDDFDIYNKERSCTLENFIKRHGEEKGIDIWDEYCERQRYTTTIDYFIEKYGEEDGTLRWERFYQGRIEAKCDRTSAQEIIVYNTLLENGLSLITQYKIRRGRTFIYDYANIEKKLLIEYNGNVWHMNPEIYNADSVQPRTNILAKDIWERDARKKNVAEEDGFTVYVIWEKDWKTGKNIIVEEIKRLYNEK